MPRGSREVRTRFSFIIPFKRGLGSLARCLDALHPLRSDNEVIIATDDAEEDCRALAESSGARIVSSAGPSGPAAARNAAAAQASGDVLVFIDADVVASRAGLARLVRIFNGQPATAAAFGAYDERPADRHFVSQYKNLSHGLIHRTSAGRARTFWAGFGAVRRDAFRDVGGFDERFMRPSVEDIDFGYRLAAAGYEIVLDPRMSATHLKRWTLASTIASDIRDRGIPWTQLIWRYGALHDDLNLRTEYRWSVILACLMAGAAASATQDLRALVALPFLGAGSVVLNWRICDYFYRTRGLRFAAGAWAMRLIHDLGNSVSFAVGTVLFVAGQYLNVSLPGGLPTESWSATQPRVASRTFDRTVPQEN